MFDADCLSGANFHEVITKHRSLLITNDSRADLSEKIKYAHENNIPVVTGEWLVECLKDHTRHPYEKFLIKPPADGVSQPGERRFLLGDKFKRKLEEPPTKEPNKRPHITSENEGEGNLPQHSTSNMHISKPRESERILILNGCVVCVSKQFKASFCSLEARRTIC